MEQYKTKMTRKEIEETLTLIPLTIQLTHDFADIFFQNLLTYVNEGTNNTFSIASDKITDYIINHDTVNNFFGYISANLSCNILKNNRIDSIIFDSPTYSNSENIILKYVGDNMSKTKRIIFEINYLSKEASTFMQTAFSKFRKLYLEMQVRVASDNSISYGFRFDSVPI